MGGGGGGGGGGVPDETLQVLARIVRLVYNLIPLNGMYTCE